MDTAIHLGGSERMDFGSRLKEARKTAHMTQQALGEEIEVSGVAVRMWENGLRRPGIERVKRIAQTLGVTLEYLMGEEERPKVLAKQLVPGLEQLLRARKMYRLSEEDQKALKAYIDYLYSKTK